MCAIRRTRTACSAYAPYTTRTDYTCHVCCQVPRQRLAGRDREHIGASLLSPAAHHIQARHPGGTSRRGVVWYTACTVCAICYLCPHEGACLSYVYCILCLHVHPGGRSRRGHVWPTVYCILCALWVLFVLHVHVHHVVVYAQAVALGGGMFVLGAELLLIELSYLVGYWRQVLRVLHVLCTMT